VEAADWGWEDGGMADPDRKKFNSFKDLRRSRGDQDEEVPGPAQRGWTIEGQRSADELCARGDSADGSRERIDARPDASGSMNTGPPCYRDPDSDEIELLHSFRARLRFPEDVGTEIASLPGDPDPTEFKGRLDLRNERIFTIDGASARDFDDAISIEQRGQGQVEVGVHIADVAHYVRPGTALDGEALARGTSVYLPDQVIPMLPEGLSNQLCSLVPGRPRLAYSVFMLFDAGGQRLESRVAKSVIQSVHRNTYKGVQELLDGTDSAEARECAFLEPDLRLFETWTRRQQALRDARGSLRIQSTEKLFLFDDEHEVRAIVDAARYFSQTLIEETALAANQAVGDLFRSKGLPTIYRVHPEKDPEEFEGVIKVLAEHGIRVPEKERLTGRDIGRLIRAARRKPNAQALLGRIMGLVERAVYEVKDHEDVAKHFGLAREAYLHFTSPIRRYPDLLVHRWLARVEGDGTAAAEELRTQALVEDLNDVAAHCSVQADLAGMAEVAVKDLKVCQYMEPHIGKRLDAKVLRVSRAGMEVELTEFNVTGFLPTRTLGERPKLNGPTLTVRAGRRSLSFTEGYAITVQIRDVDFLRLQVLLELP